MTIGEHGLLFILYNDPKYFQRRFGEVSGKYQGNVWKIAVSFEKEI